MLANVLAKWRAGGLHELLTVIFIQRLHFELPY